MNAPLDELYLTWLYSQVGSVKLRSPSRTYWTLFKLLFTKEFVWIIPNDDNRVEDGRDLRFEFLDEREIDEVDPDWMSLGCSMFEMLIGLSRRLSFEDDGEACDWFWRLLENLGLSHLTDDMCDEQAKRDINETLDNVIWRTYSPDGFGGLFPLESTTRDQRDVEIWYQLSEYLLGPQD